MKTEDIRICVIGLGYVGLPLARLFSTKFPTVGFDMNQARVDALMSGHDATMEVDDTLLHEAISPMAAIPIIYIDFFILLDYLFGVKLER